MMQITEPGKQVTARFVPFALGFRPFFLLAGFSGFLLLAYWVITFSQGWSTSTLLAGSDWHAHEMIFGYSAAVIAGFLLTAVRNWTGVNTLNGRSLMLLALSWVLARVLALTSLAYYWFVLVDMLFLPLLAVAIACPIIKVKQWKNLFFVPLLVLYAVANAVFHAEILFNMDGLARAGSNGGLGVVIMIITIMAGRVVGFFIERGLQVTIRMSPLAEKLALWGTGLYMAGQFFLPTKLLTLLAVIAATGHLLRLRGWYHKQIWQEPLLWILFTGYCWLLVGFVLSILSLNHLLSPSLAIHAFTSGAIGIITVGMMARVALGHTGRAMQVHPAMTLSFLLINMAVVVRVLLPLLNLQQYMLWIQLSGLLWVTAFVIFSVVYLPVLLRPRVDGTPG